MSATAEISTATAGRRIAALAGHLTPGDGGEHATGLSKQGCAATQVSAFGRPVSSGASFARQAQQQFSRDERVYETAVLYGNGVLNGIPPAEDAAKAYPKAYPTSPQRSGAPAPVKTISKGGTPNSFEAVTGWTPQANIVVGPHGFTYVFRLPGVKAGDLQLNLSGSKLNMAGKRVCGLRHTQAPLQHSEVPVRRASDSLDVREQAKAVRRPAVVEEGSFEATWVLPEGDYARMRAQFANERLRVTLPLLPRKLKLRSRHNAGI